MCQGLLRRVPRVRNVGIILAIELLSQYEFVLVST